MYGKSFQRMYQGSMVGSGAHVFAVWGYCISCADPEEHTVELNPVLLATVLGETPERVQQAIEYLTAPDPHSHCTDHAGRRLLRQDGYEYFVVTHSAYRDMKNNEELRAYFREAKRKSRMSKTVQDGIETVLESLKTSASASASASAGDRGGGKGEFQEAWTLYPDKAGRHAASVSYAKWRKAGDTQEEIKAGIERYIASVTRRRANGFPDLKFQNGSTFFNQRGWKSEWAEANTPSATPVRYARRSDCQRMPATFTPPEGKEHEYAKVS